MTGPASDPAIETIAAAAMEALGEGGRQIAPFTSRDPAFDLDRAYRVTPIVRRLREARGERVVGRKIGFTNRNIWAQYGVYAPIWGYVYDSTMHDLAALDGPVPLAAFAEPRIEPEIVFGLASAPRAGMDEAALLSCIGWVAHGFEIVQSIFPGWVFAPADTVAAFGLHGALFVGERHPVAERRDEWLRALSDFSVTLRCGDVVEHGHARDVLDGPLSALKHLVDLLAGDAHNPPLAAGEIVTTGTLTLAMPVKAGERWSTELAGIPLDGISIAFH
jgi:2-oxo-3-hexenedioate decarboxylase